MILHAAVLGILATASLPAEARFLPLEQSLRDADRIVTGRIVAIRTPRKPSEGGWTDAGSYEFEVERVFTGGVRVVKPEGAEERLIVDGCGDWTCEERSVEYAVGQELFLLLARDGESWRPVYGFQSEFIVEDGEFRQANYPRGLGPAAAFFDALPAILDFVELPPQAQQTAWVELLRHEKAELRRFGMRRFHELFFLDEAAGGGYEAYAALTDEGLVALFEGVVEGIPAEPGQRAAAIRALLYLWEHFLHDRPLELRGRVKSSRLDAIARLQTPSPDTSERDRAKSFYMRATLGSLETLPELLEVLRSDDHDRHFEALSALEGLAETVELRRREPLDVLAAHPAGERCEAALGRSALTLVVASGLSPSFHEEGMSLRATAAAFRPWWAAHRDELPE